MKEQKNIEQLRTELEEIQTRKDIKKRIFKSQLPASFKICLKISSAIIAGLIVGSILDSLLGTKFAFKIGALLLGCVSSFRVIYNMIKR